MKKFIPILFIFLVVLVVFLTNYTSNTWLTGWDNLHPEFNFSLNIKRSIFAVWQEYQGLGLVGGMAHASDLPRQVLLWLVSFILPQNLLRYFYHFLMLFVGMVGVYKFVSEILLEGKKTNNPETKLSKIEEKTDGSSNNRSKVSLLGSLFYLLNLGTISYFFVPFEPYSTFWAFFPWEIYILFKYIKKPTKKNLIYLAIINFLAIPQAYVQTIFLVYLIYVFLILALAFFKKEIKKRIAFNIVLVIFLLNSFWILPNIYFTLNNLSVTQNAMQNKMATDKFFQMNKARGTMADFPILREFYYDFFDYNQNTNQFDYLLNTWRNHFSNLYVLVIGYGFFLIILFGVFRKNKYRIYLLALFTLSLIVFLSDTIFISLINAIFRSLPLVNQIFRNPFTKFIVPAIFIFSCGFSLGIDRLMSLSKLKKIYHFPGLIFIIFFSLIVIYALPVFRGNFIDSSMRVSIPKEYFDLFDYFKTQDVNARIMNLPQGGFWGWDYYSWGARGSGFIWYGIEQPIVDRTFDVWSKENENYYWELSYALEKRDKNLLNNVLDKYQIGFIIFDSNLIFTDNTNSSKTILKEEELLKDDQKIEEVERFGKIVVYKIKLKETFSNNLLMQNKLPSVQESGNFNSKDNAFEKLNFYSSSGSPDYVFPFGSLFTNRFSSEKNFNLTENKDAFIIENKIPAGKYILNLPSFREKESNIPTRIFAKLESNKLILRFAPLFPRINVNFKSISNVAEEKDVTMILDESFLNSPAILDINNNDFFELKNLGGSFQKIGDVYLVNQDQANYFRLYSQKQADIKALSPDNFFQAQNCSERKGIVNSTTQNNGLIINAENSAACAGYKDVLIGEKSLIKISFVYKSSSDEFPQYCLFAGNDKRCLNDKDVIKTGFSEKPSLYTDYVENESFNGQIYLNFILDATRDEDQDKLKSINYSDINITTYPLLTGKVIELATKDSSSKVDLNLQTDSYITVDIPKTDNSSTLINPIKKGLYKRSPLNYDNKMPGQFSLEEANSNLRLGAKDASSYLLLRDSGLNTGNGYILNVDSSNDKGFPFVVNVFTNLDYRNYVYSYAQKGKTFNNNYFILPPVYEFDKGMNILLSSNSYSSEETINELSDISIYPIPYQYITNIFLSKGSPLMQGSLSIEAKKVNLSLYEAKIDSAEDGSLILSQSYDKGWKAYKQNFQFSIFNFQISDYLPFFFGKEIKEHVVVNNWENGWSLNESGIKNQELRIIIIFWPQYLEFAGFGLLVLGLAYVLFLSKKNLQ